MLIFKQRKGSSPTVFFFFLHVAINLLLMQVSNAMFAPCQAGKMQLLFYWVWKGQTDSPFPHKVSFHCCSKYSCRWDSLSIIALRICIPTENQSFHVEHFIGNKLQDFLFPFRRRGGSIARSAQELNLSLQGLWIADWHIHVDGYDAHFLAPSTHHNVKITTVSEAFFLQQGHAWFPMC